MKHRTFAQRYDRIAYGAPKELKNAGPLTNAGANIGTRIVQYVYFRPEAAGYRLATGKRRK
jgi:hypothetical protein